MFFQDGDQSKKEKEIPHHGPKPISIICHLPNIPTFSFIPTIKVKKKNKRKVFFKLSKNTWKSIELCGKILAASPFFLRKFIFILLVGRFMSFSVINFWNKNIWKEARSSLIYLKKSRTWAQNFQNTHQHGKILIFRIKKKFPMFSFLRVLLQH
jgi:hypothetical protein